MIKRIVIASLLVVLSGTGISAAVAVMHAQSGLEDAEELLAHQLWPQARERLADYLWLHPNDAQARILLAE
ncbi:MAG: hypothetical protein KY475_26440, partial [Planctomycetes bacterium]|nr:hypothetical protein [Planctomycetota bacterium]